MISFCVRLRLRARLLLLEGLFNGSNGVQYAGEWIKGRQEGWGMQWGGVEGGLYVGEWHDGAAQGRGTSVNNKGSYWVRTNNAITLSLPLSCVRVRSCNFYADNRMQ